MIWIRSQNKEVLIECKEVHIFGWDATSYRIDSRESNYILGEYSTKEKALKVLDMIQERIGNIENIKSNQCMVKPNFLIFQLPQDDEVVEDEKS